MGADRAILVETSEMPDPLSCARALLEIVNRENPELVILGKQAIDNDNAQTGPMLAALWGRPQATFASKLEFNGDSVRVTREVDAGLDVIEVDLPAVVTADLRLNEPRYVKLPDIMKAKKKPLDQVTAVRVVACGQPGYCGDRYSNRRPRVSAASWSTMSPHSSAP